MKQKAIGEICLIRAIEYFLKKDYLVFIPISERGTADIIVDNGRNILKVQCKYTSWVDRYGYRKLKLLTTFGKKVNNRWQYKKYNNKDFHRLFICTDEDKKYLIPSKKILSEKNNNYLKPSITLSPKYNTYLVD